MAAVFVKKDELPFEHQKLELQQQKEQMEQNAQSLCHIHGVLLSSFLNPERFSQLIYVGSPEPKLG